jgi:very-short-patch-repair endonuclease
MNSWCPFCANQKLCDNKNCNYCFEKSFASHKKAKYFNIDNNTDPRYIFKGSTNKIYNFNCNNCTHNYKSNINSIVNSKIGCPYCSSQKLCDNNQCKYCFEKSFASHEKAKYWNNINISKPRELFKMSNEKYWFDCNNCSHIFESTLNNINADKWCPYCNKSKLCDDNECIECYNKSFASHEKAIFWSKDNIINPRQITKGSDNSYLFDCNKCNRQFIKILGCIARNNSWCPFCKTKTESKLNQVLKIYYPSLKHQFKVDWCKNKNHLPFDFVIEELKTIVELDGAQHFKQVSNWQSPEKTNIIDLYKMKCANENRYSVIRILQEDVFYDKYNWLADLKLNIEKIVSEKKVQNIFMCKNDEYKIFNNIDYKLINEEELPDDIEDTETNDNIMKFD